MRGKCGRHARVAAICLISGWAAVSAPAAVIHEMTPLAVPPAGPAIPSGDPKLATGPVEPAPLSLNETPPKLSSSAPLSIKPKPLAPELLNAAGDRPPVAAAAPKLNGTRADDVQVGPAGEIVEAPAVPEPSTGVLLCAVGLAALARRGRRRPRLGAVERN
jgi:hypothetical protein